MASSSQTATVWIGYMIGPVESVPARHPAELLAFATEEVARAWKNDPEWRAYLERNPYGATRTVVEREVHRVAP